MIEATPRCEILLLKLRLLKDTVILLSNGFQSRPILHTSAQVALDRELVNYFSFDAELLCLQNNASKIHGKTEKKLIYFPGT